MGGGWGGGGGVNNSFCNGADEKSGERKGEGVEIRLGVSARFIDDFARLSYKKLYKYMTYR